MKHNLSPNSSFEVSEESPYLLTSASLRDSQFKRSDSRTRLLGVIAANLEVPTEKCADSIELRRHYYRQKTAYTQACSRTLWLTKSLDTLKQCSHCSAAMTEYTQTKHALEEAVSFTNLLLKQLNSQ